MAAFFSGLLTAGCSVFGIRTEQTPSYTVERTIGSADGQVEVRHYGPRLAAETTVDGRESEARSAGFRRLAGFIFGGNSSDKSIDMTAPVAQARTQADAWRIRFFMPADYTSETLPKPKDGAVSVITVPPETVAVLRYSGSISPDSVHAAEQRLLSTVKAAGLTPVGAPFTWFYDPPWTLPPLRRNEAVVRVEGG